MFKSLQSQSISKKIEENLYSFYDIIAKSSGKTGYRGVDVSWVITKPSYWPNQIYDVRFNKKNLEKRVMEILETPNIFYSLVIMRPFCFPGGIYP